MREDEFSRTGNFLRNFNNHLQNLPDTGSLRAESL